MKLISDLFPLFATFAVIALCGFAIRLWVKIGRGAISAGSREVIQAKPTPVSIKSPALSLNSSSNWNLIRTKHAAWT